MPNYRYKKVIRTYGDGHTQETFLIQERIFWNFWLNVKETNCYLDMQSDYEVYSEGAAKEMVKRLESKLIVSNI